MKGAVIDWDRVCQASSTNLTSVLDEIPQRLWNTRERGLETTLLYYAARGESPKATKRLLAHGIDPNETDIYGYDAAYAAICYKRPENMRLLVCAGLDPSRSRHIDLSYIGYCEECCRVLITNGIWKPPGWALLQREALRRAFVSFRSCIIALLGIKRFRSQLKSVDRFLIRALALEIWATRTDL